MKTLLILLGDDFLILSFAFVFVCIVVLGAVALIKVIKKDRLGIKTFFVLMVLCLFFIVFVTVRSALASNKVIISHNFFTISNSYIKKFYGDKNMSTELEAPRWFITHDGYGGVIHYRINSDEKTGSKDILIWMQCDDHILCTRATISYDENSSHVLKNNYSFFSSRGELPTYADVGMEEYDKLNRSIEESNNQVALALIDKLSLFSLSHADSYRITPIMRAVSRDNIVVVEALLNKRVDINIENIFFDTVYNIAQRRNNPQIINLLANIKK